MTNMLFTFRRSVKDPENPEKPILQDNYLNPFQVISAYWDQRGEKKVLNVFTLTYTFTLNESVGKVFLTHWETALRQLISVPGSNVAMEQQTSRERRQRTVMDATAVDDLDLTEAANWQQQ